MGKLSRERWVCAPQYLSTGTSISPKASVSVRVYLSLSYVVVDALLERLAYLAGLGLHHGEVFCQTCRDC